MPRKENTKARTWERDRRERMNAYFKTLEDLLPTHQDGRKRNKVDILIQAAKYIKDLHGRTEDLFHAHASEVHKEELARLKKVVAQLFSRTQLLSTLLKEAGISIPAEPAIEKVSAYKWSNKINAEDSEKLFFKLEEKKRAKKKKAKVARNKVPSKRKSVTTSQCQSKRLTSDDPATNADDRIEDQENRVHSVNNGNKLSNDETDIGTTAAGLRDNVLPATNPIPSAETKGTSPDRRGTNSSKLDSYKKVKRKSKTNQKNKIVNQRIGQTVANLTPGTLILSGGKIMPVVTPISPLTSNIIVNAQSQSTSPIILSNAQSSQMIVMQHLPNPCQNSVIPVCNQTLINAVQKVTLNPMPNMQANIVVSSHDWVTNVKSIINATKISGRKCILPKGREITKTTMTYKVPIPAVHKEKPHKMKEVVIRKETEAKTKPKNIGKTVKKNSQNSDDALKPSTINQVVNTSKSETPVTLPLKRILNTECTSQDEPVNKKVKGTVGLAELKNVDIIQANNLEIADETATCKSIESLRHVVQKIGSDMNDATHKTNNSTIDIETDKILDINNEKPNSPKRQDFATSSSNDKISNQPSSQADGNNKLLNCPNPISAPVTKQDHCGIVKPTDSPQRKDLGEAQESGTDVSNLNDVMESTKFSEGTTVSTETLVVGNSKPEVSVAKESELSAPNITTTATKSDVSDIDEVRKEDPISDNVKEVCNLGTRFDSLLQANVKKPEMVESVATLETSKIILNLDTNTTTTVKPDSNTIVKPINPILQTEDDSLRENKLGNFAKDEGLKSLSYSADNSFIPISRTEALHSDLSNDIFASLQVPSSSHHPESISPTAAFLMAFPLVSSLNGKTEVLEEEMKEDFKYRSQTPPMLLQIGAIEPNSFKLKTNTSVLLKENVPTTQHGVTDAEKRKWTFHSVSQKTTNTQKYMKSTSTDNKELDGTAKISNDQCEVKGNQNLVTQMQMQHKSELQAQDNSQVLEIQTTKALPKILHSENLKEQYKIVQTSIPLSLTTPVEMNNTFVYTSANSTISYSTTPVITTCAASQIQSTPTVHNIRPAVKNVQNLVASIQANCNPVSNSSADLNVEINSSFQTLTETHTPIAASVSKYDMRTQYTSTQNFIPNYPNISGNMELPQYTPPTFTSSVHKSSQNSLSVHVSNISGLTNVSLASSLCHGISKNPTSTHNQQHNYSVQNKDSHSAPSTNQNSSATESLRSKQQGQEHRHESYHPKKVDTENFGQNFSFNKDNTIISQNHGGQGNGIVMFQEKHTTAQSYMPYSKDNKKILATMTSAAASGKSVLENAVHYPQNPMIAASNYEHSTVTENNIKSTTTVAHNSSNFSILSWTTFSPVTGTNNTMHYEQAQPPPDTTENKTICENFGYVPIHKENVGFSNMLPEYPNESALNVNKLGNKPMLEPQKQPFIDQSKSQNIQPAIASQKQNQNTSIDYKFNNENKAKGKYTIENNFMQTNYPNMEQQAKHQTVPHKLDKANYPMPSYNPQVLFNVSEAPPQVKYSTENYTGANFKYTEKPQQNQKYQPPCQTHAPTLDSVNSVYKQNQNGNKSKVQQIRPPVNWMMTPEIKHNTNISDIILPPIGKELDYCQNNLFTQNTSYNQGATNQFYNNYDNTHNFPNIPVLQNDPKKVDAFYSEDQRFSWSPTKNTHVVEQTQPIKPIDQHIVPSTLPTLVGDLALGTNVPEKQNFLFGQMPTRLPSEHKDLIKEKDSNTVREFHTIINPQNGQHAAQGTFLSVSQLVEHEKAEKSQQARKHQRKSISPRGSGKRQLDIRKQVASDQLHHDDQKTNVQSFPEQTYQQKYQQNDAQWRNRNCKSNYTAEALIGTNTNVQEDNQQDKHASIKFTSNYGQNKFPGTLPADAMMPINYFPNTDEGNNYGQANQNFNSYTYSSNSNIYPTTNFITSISNTPTSYMMPLHENSDYLETNTFLLPNSTPAKPQHFTGKHQNCDKRSYSTLKRSKRKPDMSQNIDFPLSGINSPLEDYHSSFLSHANLYQNPPQANIYPKTVNTNLPGLPMTANQNTVGTGGLSMNSNIPRGTSSNSPMVMAHPSGTSLTNFNLSTIFPEINDKVAGYKPPNSMPAGLTQPTGHGLNYTQRTNYANPLGHVPQVSEAAQFTNNMPSSTSTHYKNS